jgi:hypothetical protein
MKSFWVEIHCGYEVPGIVLPLFLKVDMKLDGCKDMSVHV